MIRCDEPMKRSKESAAERNQIANQWRCSGDCYRCICGLRKNPNGTWSHINTQSKKLVMDEERIVDVLQE